MGRDERPDSEDIQPFNAKTPLGARMRLAREGKGISLTDLADRLGYGKSHLSSVETGIRMPSETLVTGYERELGLQIGELKYDVRESRPLMIRNSRQERALMLNSPMLKSLADVLHAVAPIDATAQRLLDAATAEANRRMQAVDVTHVIFAMLLDPWPIQDVYDSPAIRQLLTNPRAMDELRGALRALVNMQPNNISILEGASVPIHASSVYAPACTDTLERCIGVARRYWVNAPLNSALLIWAFLSDDNPARHAVVGILDDLMEPGFFDDIITDLVRRVARGAPSPHLVSHPAVDHGRWIPERLTPHKTFQHAVRHRELMLDIVDAVHGREHHQFVVVSGLNGSPLHHVPQILADAIGQDAIHFRDLTSVWWADAGDYKNWADPPITPGGDLLLQEGIEHAKAQGGIFVLEHLEVLVGTGHLTRTPLQEHLLGQLHAVRGAAVVALYETPRGANPDAALTALGLDAHEAILIAIEPVSVSHALLSLCDSFLPAWNERGFVFDGDITDRETGPYHDLLALMGGAKAQGKPMALPYLLVDITEHLFTRREEPRAIKGWAQTAEDRVNELLAETPGMHPAAVLQHYKPLLAEALQQVQPLKANPAMERHGTHYVITRRHLTAAFLGSAFSRFSYPDSL